MGSASREHKVKKGKGSFRRRKKHQKVFNACIDFKPVIELEQLREHYENLQTLPSA